MSDSKPHERHEILYRCKSAAVPWYHLLLLLLMVHAPICPPRMARSSTTNSGVITSHRKKKQQGKAARLVRINLSLIIFFSLKESRVMMQRQKDRNTIEQLNKGGWVSI